MQDGEGAGGGWHKGGYGTAGHGDGASAGTGDHRAHTGRPKPGARADQDGPHP